MIDKEVLHILNEELSLNQLIEEVNAFYAEYLDLKKQRLDVAHRDSLAGFAVSKGQMTTQKKDDIVNVGHVEMDKLDTQIQNMKEKLELSIEQVEAYLEAHPISGSSLFLSEDFIRTLAWRCGDAIDRLKPNTVTGDDRFRAIILRHPHDCEVINEMGRNTVLIKFLELPDKAPTIIDYKDLDSLKDGLIVDIQEILSNYGLQLRVNERATKIQRQNKFIEFRIVFDI